MVVLLYMPINCIRGFHAYFKVLEYLYAIYIYVIWSVQMVPKMTPNVSGGTLTFTHSLIMLQCLVSLSVIAFSFWRITGFPLLPKWPKLYTCIGQTRVSLGIAFGFIRWLQGQAAQQCSCFQFFVVQKGLQSGWICSWNSRNVLCFVHYSSLQKGSHCSDCYFLDQFV